MMVAAYENGVFQSLFYSQQVFWIAGAISVAFIVILIYFFCNEHVKKSAGLKSKEKLRESEIYNKLLFQNSRSPIVVMDTNTGYFIDCNQAAVVILGFMSREETLKTSSVKISAPFQKNGESSRQLAEYYRGVCRQRGSVIFEWLFERPDGNRWVAEVHLMSFKIDQQELMQFTLRDVTEAKRIEMKLRQSEEKFNLLSQSALDAIIMMDLDGCVTYWNRAAEQMTGYTDSESIGNKMSDLMGGFEIFTQDPLGELGWQSEGFGRIIETEFLRRDGFTIPVEMSLCTVKIDEKWHTIAIMRDIAERKHFESELRAAKEISENANKAKSTFLANISHELRTPLNVILGYSQLLQMDSSLNASQMKDLAAINSSGEHLLALINEVLEISRIEAGKTTLNLTTFCLRKIIHDMETMFRVRAQQKNLVLTAIVHNDVPEYIVSDSGKLRQILINLIGNAVKFSDSGEVRMVVKTCDESPTLLSFEIEDHGPGISEEDLIEIFNPFKQSAAGIRSSGGSGLGLTICKEFTTMMGGDISVQSRLGSGSKFTVRVAFEHGHIEDVQDEGLFGSVVGVEPGQRTFKVLVVDDMEHNRTLLVRLLKRIGFETREASEGCEALQIVQEWSPEIILLDLRMPGMDGYEAIKLIKKMPYGKDCKIIVVTANVLEDHNRSIFEDNPIDGYLKKPIVANEFYYCMESISGIHLIWSVEAKKSRYIEENHIIGTWFDNTPEAFKTSMRQAIEKADLDLMTELVNASCKQDNIKSIILSLIEQFQLEQLSALFNTKE